MGGPPPASTDGHSPWLLVTWEWSKKLSDARRFNKRPLPEDPFKLVLVVLLVLPAVDEGMTEAAAAAAVEPPLYESTLRKMSECSVELWANSNTELSLLRMNCEMDCPVMMWQDGGGEKRRIERERERKKEMAIVVII